MRLTLGDGTTIDIEPGAELCSVRFRHDTISRHGWVETSDVAAWARDLLRAIAGPSIDDVRDVWGVPHADIEVQAEDVFAGCTEAAVCVWDGSRHRCFTEAVVCVWVGSRYRCFEAATLREALQAAYDAGVARATETTPPA